MGINKLSKKLSPYLSHMRIREGLNFSDYFDDSIPNEVKPVYNLTPMQEDDFPTQAKDLFKGLWENEDDLTKQISSKDLLNSKYYSFWMDKDGNFYDAKDTHLYWAIKYLEKHNITDLNCRVIDMMFKLGFLRIGILKPYKEIIFEYNKIIGFPNYKQQSSLKNAAIEIGYKLRDGIKNQYKELTESVLNFNSLLNTEYNQFWLDPSGEFHRTHNHVYWAQGWMNKNNVYKLSNQTRYDVMFSKGFIRIWIDRRNERLYFQFGERQYEHILTPNYKQMSALKNAAIELGYELYDDLRNRQIELDESLMLEDIVSNRTDYWMDNKGRFLKSKLGHGKWASQYLIAHNIPKETWGVDVIDLYEKMFSLGFIRVKVWDNEIYIEYSYDYPPNNIQWRNLKNTAIESQMKLIDGTGKRREIELESSKLGENKDNKTLFIESIMMPDDIDLFKSHLAQLFAYLQKELQLKSIPKVKLVSDDKNAAKVLGKTAYYDPDNKIVVLYITGRHQKDILRSFAHEIIHHWQHENEQLQTSKTGSRNVTKEDPEYIQHNMWLREMEKQAYLLGNIIFREWTEKKLKRDRKNGIKGV